MQVRPAVLALSICLFQGLIESGTLAHCNTIDGPLVKAARATLATSTLDLVLPWIPAAREAEIKDASELAWAVRRQRRPGEGFGRPVLPRDSGSDSSR